MSNAAKRQSSTTPDSKAPKSEPKRLDRSAKLIHDLATDPPAKDMASVKAASDVFEANKKDARRKQTASAD